MIYFLSSRSYFQFGCLDRKRLESDALIFVIEWFGGYQHMVDCHIPRNLCQSSAPVLISISLLMVRCVVRCSVCLTSQLSPVIFCFAVRIPIFEYQVCKWKFYWSLFANVKVVQLWVLWWLNSLKEHLTVNADVCFESMWYYLVELKYWACLTVPCLVKV